MFGLEGVEVALIIVFVSLFLGILSGYPVAFALGGSAIVSFVIIASLSEAGLLLDGEGEPLLSNVKQAFARNPGFVPSRIFGNILGGPNVDVLLAVPLFVLMGIALERSRVAEDLLTTMAKLFGPLPGGLAISVVVVGALLAASTGIVGATVVTMGLLALPTMLKRGYSPELATGTICASGTLGQIIPPSIVLVLLGQQVGEIYSEYHPGEVVSVGTLFKGAMLPGLLLVSLYIGYVLIYAFLKPEKAPAIHDPNAPHELRDKYQGDIKRMIMMLAGLPLLVVIFWIVSSLFGLSGNQTPPPGAENFVPPLISGVTMAVAAFIAIALVVAYAVTPDEGVGRLTIGFAGVVAFLLVAALIVTPDVDNGMMTVYQAIPIAMMLYGLAKALPRLQSNEILKVVFPPVVLIVAVLGSILGGVANPTAAAGLGAGGAIMLAAIRTAGKEFSTKPLHLGGLAVMVLVVLVSVFDLRLQVANKPIAEWIAVVAAIVVFHIVIASLLYGCYVLIKKGIMRDVVQSTAMITSMVFFILIGSQVLNLVLKSFDGDSYIQEFLLSVGGDDRRFVLLMVMIVIFLMGFVLDFLEIIYIVIPIVGPVIFSGDLDPVWVTILIAVNLQTSFLTPPFGFALFYLRGVAPASVKTRQIYRGVLPYVLIQVLALTILWFIEPISTFLPSVLPEG